VKRIFGQDLYVFNYVVSEIFDAEELEGMQEVLQAMVDSAPSGAQVIVIDRKEQSVVNKARKLMEGAGLDVADPVECCENMDYDEQCSDLGPHLIQDHFPRIKWNSFWMIGRKA